MDPDVCGELSVDASTADPSELEVVPLDAGPEEEPNPNRAASPVSVLEIVEEPREGGDLGLPEDIAKGVVVLQCESSAAAGICEVYLVGTAHVSQESCRKVQAVIRHLKPQAVFLELCASRADFLTPQELQVPSMTQMIDSWKKKKMNVFEILNSWYLAKAADECEVFPGSEFGVAFEEAMSYGAEVVLGDRPIHITEQRTWGKMPLWHKAKFLAYMLTLPSNVPSQKDLNENLNEMDDVDILTHKIQVMSEAFPTLIETLLHERDMYMSSELLKVARKHSLVVAVVGKGHLPGIKQHWKQPIEVRHLLEVPVRRSGISTRAICASLGLVIAGFTIYLVTKR